MFGLFKKKEPKKVCVHDWHLIDMFSVSMNNYVEVEIVDYYKVGCTKCNETKDIDEHDFLKFKRIFIDKSPNN